MELQIANCRLQIAGKIQILPNLASEICNLKSLTWVARYERSLWRCI